MKLIREKIIDFFKDEDMKQFATSITKPITNYIYDEVYLIYIVFLYLSNLSNNNDNDNDLSSIENN